MQPILSQTLKNSPNVGVCSPPVVRAASIVAILSLKPPFSRRFGWPVVPLAGGMAQPREQRIVDHEAVAQHAVIVIACQGREPKRDGVQAGGLRRETGPRGVRAAYDQCQSRERRLAF